MRVESFPASLPRAISVVLAVVAVSGLAGCKTKKAADDPTVIGIPPARAYLGVEYYYNFGADGGEGILSYSLTNAPSWLGLEDTSNKARQGIIMRGVPGITGGERGDADLGETKNITLLTTDGSRVGLQPFNITVETNDITLLGADLVEGSADTDSYDSGAEDSCELPPMGGPGEHTYTVNLYDDAGEQTGTSEKTSSTQPVLVRVTLDQPSVVETQLAFELRSQFNPDDCESGANVTPPHQMCEYSSQNQSRATLGHDVVGWGNGSFGDLPVPEYLAYQLDDNGVDYTKGVITLAPGITECYIRLEVIDDAVAEEPETFTLAFTDIREGMVSFGNGKNELDIGLVIKDNEPSASLETVLGLSRDAINAELAPANPADIPEYVVRLNGEREGTFKARLGSTPISSAIAGQDYELQVPAAGGGWQAGNELTFPDGVDEARFRVVTLNTFANFLDNDKFVDIIIDETFQAGREGYAGSEQTSLHVGLNELTSSLLVGNDGGFVPTDMKVGHDGRIFVAGYDSVGGQAEIRVWDRLGAPSLGPIVLPAAPVVGGGEPVLAYAEKLEAANEWSRRLVISWGTDGSLNGATNAGGTDLVTVLLKFDSVPGTYVPVWEIQSGTSGNDNPRWAGLDPTYTVFVSGETSGVWPGQIGAGGVDSFVQRIDDQEEGADLVPAVAWTRQAGSGLDETVVGGGLASQGAMAAGNTRGSVNGAAQLGEDDIFFFTATSRDLDLNVYQRGTQAADITTAVSVSDNLVWLTGNSQGRYFGSPVINEDGEETFAKALTREATNSQAGFLLRYTPGGGFTGAKTFNDADDVSTETLLTNQVFDQAVIVAGSSDGDFSGDGSNPAGELRPILARVSSASPLNDPESEEIWRSQPAEPNARIVKLANYRNDEITALVEMGSAGSRTWAVVLFSGEGRQLNSF
ncbi:hypothetical protein [Marinobacter zhejiangensis]|uniref:Uncharacterized protein n=1 Tax=Marinobacter zhejiangensis TaxID=488535 RepID=A0A1I4PBE7_9GAMM|nr:hypothetical protein [Marinobacter zhejiangensis]SFM25092.1 hypothetical protein SAMN04487963_1916 [Marinobacter zhejiangensis]